MQGPHRNFDGKPEEHTGKDQTGHRQCRERRSLCNQTRDVEGLFWSVEVQRQERQQHEG